MNGKTYNVTDSGSVSLDSVCELFSGYADEFDDIGNQIRRRSPTSELFCAEVSAPSNEYYRAKQTGIKPETVLLVDSESYSCETHAVYDGDEFEIYRVYRRGDGITELYLKKETANE